MSALARMFHRTRSEHRAALIGYLPAGYPDLGRSGELIDAVVAGGADAVEVGMPFSDPVLDGATISEAQRGSLARGFATTDLFPLVERVADRGAVPVVMSYINPVLAYGVDRFARDLASAGGSGMITPDLIVDEADDWLAAADTHALDPIFLVAPSSPADRIDRTVRACRGFVYAASVMGTTGARDTVSADAPALVERTRRHTDLPVGVGLGVRTRAQAGEIAAFADAVIVGSALVAAGDRGPAALGELTRELAAGVRESTGRGRSEA